MLVRALKSFGGNGVHHSDGDVFELPARSDWLRAGLVEMVGQPESAMLAPAKGRAAGDGLKPVVKVAGVGKATARLLQEIGIETVAQLAAADEAQLAAVGMAADKGGQAIEAAREMLR